MGVKMGWMGHPLARNGAALAPFRANGAHPRVNSCIYDLMLDIDPMFIT